MNDANSLTRGEIPRPPAETGALRRGGQPFGSYEDATDLHQPIFTNLDIDLAFVALVEPLPPSSAALIAFAADGWQPALDAARAIRAEVVRGSTNMPDRVDDRKLWVASRAGDALYRCGVGALRWAAHRRRAYVGMDDPWPVESCFSWSWRSDRIADGTADPALFAEIEHNVAREAVRRDGDDDF